MRVMSHLNLRLIFVKKDPVLPREKKAFRVEPG